MNQSSKFTECGSNAKNLWLIAVADQYLYSPEDFDKGLTTDKYNPPTTVSVEAKTSNKFSQCFHALNIVSFPELVAPGSRNFRN